MAVTETLKFKSTVPNGLKYLNPSITDIELKFTVDAKDLDPLTLQELSEEVRAGYLVPLDKAWADMWKKWDKDLESKIPEFANKTKGAREKLLTVYISPLEKEYEKQIGNIKSQAQKIGEKYWKDLAKKRKEITKFKLKIGATVAFKGLQTGVAITTIVTSGGAAAASYYTALKSLYEIYKEIKKLTASADEYLIKCHKNVEEIKTALFKRNGIKPDDYKALLKADKQIKKKFISDLKSDLGTFRVKIDQIHRKAQAAAKELDTALKNVGPALSADPSAQKKHEDQVKKLLSQIDDFMADYKKLDNYYKTAVKFQKDTESRLTEEDKAYKILAKAGSATGDALKFAAETLLQTTSDIAAAKAASNEGLSVATVLSGWSDKIDTGLKVLDTVIGFF